MNIGISKRRILPFLLVAILAFTGTQALAAQAVYVSIVGSAQDEILGDSTVTSLDREDTIEALEYHHLMEFPEFASGIDHQTIIITKRFDRSTPHLLQAMDTGEGLEVLFRFFRPDGMGGEEMYQSILLTDARIVSIEPLSPDTVNPETAGRPATERIRFSYLTITLVYEPTGDTYQATTNPH